MKEIWKKISTYTNSKNLTFSFEDYEISNYGKIRKIKDKKYLNFFFNKKDNGFLQVILRDNTKKQRIIFVHLLMADNFLEFDPTKQEKKVIFIDNNRENLKINNLKYQELNLSNIFDEEWKTIKDFSNYQISNYGNIRNKISNKILKLKLDKDGYYIVCIYKNNKKTYFRINRLVAEYFVKKENNDYDIVNHLDGNRKNNFYKNLEWTDIKGNAIHAYKYNFGGLKDNIHKISKISANKRKIKCECIDLNTNEKNIFTSYSDCSKYTKINAAVISNGLLKKDYIIRKNFKILKI